MPIQKKKKTPTELDKLKYKSAQYTKLSEIRKPKEPLVIYLGFPYSIFRIILTIADGPKRYLIDKMGIRNNNIISIKKTKKETSHILFAK